MKSTTVPKIVMGLLGACFAQTGVATLWIWSIGDFTVGKASAFAMGVGCLVIALPFFAFLFSRRVAKVLGVIVLLGFAASMAWLAFLPNTPAPDPTIYQVGAIALCVLLVARLALRLRAKRA